MDEEKTIPLALKLAKKPSEMAASLSSLGLSGIDVGADSISILHSEASDIEGKPHRFIRLTLAKNGSEISYSVAKDDNPAKRKIQAVEFALHAICASGASGNCCDALFGLCADALFEAASQLSGSHDLAQAEISSLWADIDELEKKNAALQSERDAEAKKASALSARLDSLLSAVQKLKSIPDDVLDAEVLGHLKLHKGKIDLREFSSSRGIPPSMAESSLKRLSENGCILRVE